MRIGKMGRPVSALCGADAHSISIRGRDLCGDLMGRLTFTDYFFLLVTGREPTDDQRFFLDLLLVTIAEHGQTPTAQAARMTYDADPRALQGAVAAGILGCGSVVLGTSELCGEFLVEAAARVKAGEAADAVLLDIVTTRRRRGEKLPGFGHPLHKPLDPRSERILALAAERGIEGLHCDLARRLPAVVEQAWGKPLVMNVSMATAAVLLDLEFPAAIIKAIPILGRTAGLLAHLAEEQRNPIGFLMAAHGEEAVAYDPHAFDTSAEGDVR